MGEGRTSANAGAKMRIGRGDNEEHDGNADEYDVAHDAFLRDKSAVKFMRPV
jgi:hypothetical protein